MRKRAFSADTDFTVGEEKALHYVLAILFACMFLYGVIDAASRNFRKIDYQSYVFILALVPVYYCVKRARSNRIFIRINKKGIYQDEHLLTGWEGYLAAYVTQKEKKSFFDVRDNFILVLEYRKNGKGYRRNIPLTNTQNRSEEEVLAAVNFFQREYAKKAQ